MQPALTKTQSTAVPTRILSNLKQFESAAEETIRNKEEQLSQWFIDNVLRYEDPHIPRIEMLSRAENIVKSSITNPKYLNTLFLD